MVIDAMRGYVQLASGLGDVTKQKASQAARQLVEQGGGLVSGVASSAGSADLARQVQGLAEDLLATSRTNRDILIGLIRTEVERTVNRLGLVGADELSAMARVVERLQNQLDAAIAFGGKASGSASRSSDGAPHTAPGRRPVKRAPVTFASQGDDAPPAGAKNAAAPAAKKSVARKSPAKKTAAKKSAAKKVPVKKVAATKVAATKPTPTPGPQATSPTTFEAPSRPAIAPPTTTPGTE
jgi:hypothetical protein